MVYLSIGNFFNWAITPFRRVLLAVCLGSGLVAFSSYAQQESSSTSEPEQVESESSDNQPDNVDGKNTKPEETEPTEQAERQDATPPPPNPDATFTPTEEISEDQPVPFPVDI